METCRESFGLQGFDGGFEGGILAGNKGLLLHGELVGWSFVKDLGYFSAAHQCASDYPL